MARIVKLIGFGDDAPERRIAVDFGGDAAHAVTAFDQARREFRIGLVLVYLGIEKLLECDVQGCPHRLAIRTEERESLCQLADDAYERKIVEVLGIVTPRDLDERRFLAVSLEACQCDHLVRLDADVAAGCFGHVIEEFERQVTVRAAAKSERRGVQSPIYLSIPG